MFWAHENQLIEFCANAYRAAAQIEAYKGKIAAKEAEDSRPASSPIRKTKAT